MHINTFIASLLTLPLLTLSAPSHQHPESDLTSKWTIKSFTRNVTDPLVGKYSFGIDNGVDKIFPCSIVDVVVAPETSSHHSWFDVGCKDAPDYHISWGWNHIGDFTVMTVEHRPSSQEAFFGYLHPNAASSYPDVGPNPVQHV